MTSHVLLTLPGGTDPWTILYGGRDEGSREARIVGKQELVLTRDYNCPGRSMERLVWIDYMLVV